jgi:OmpA-OmpF porin, OOP family
MINAGQRLIWVIGLPIAIVLASSGCATKKYVNSRIDPVNQKLGQFEKQTNDKIAFMNRKQDSEMAQVNQRFASADEKMSQLAGAVQETQGTASRAMEDADAAKSSSAAVSTVETDIANALNYHLIEKADVMFGFNKDTLTPSAMAALDEVASKFESTPRGVVELTGFTDPIGTKEFNLGLSRRRAWAVERYLVAHKVPIRYIHVVGMGKEAPPEGLEHESNAGSPMSERNRMARRVNISVFGAGEIAGASDPQQ